MKLLWPAGPPWPARTVPVSINTVQHPLPSALRCWKLGQAIRRAVRDYDKDLRVLIVGTGGMSHQLDGERAGFINTEFDQLCMRKLIEDPLALTRYSSADLVELAGTQGVEILNWIAARGAMHDKVVQLHSNYHIPISNTATGLMLMENAV
jgi:protocatechuate 4,5-dioxygenase beta chain